MKAVCPFLAARGFAQVPRLPLQAGCVLVFLFVIGARLIAQSAPSAQTEPNPNSGWETAAGGQLEFDVISIHPEKDPDADSGVNVPFGPEDTYTDTGGVFKATNWPAVRLINFAYKNMGIPEVFRASLPDWATSEGFNIEARTDKQHVTKDQMRMMVRSMLMERFKLKAHYDARQVSAYAVEVIKPGTLGPGLRPHPNDDSCSGSAASVRERPAVDGEGGAQPPTPAAAPPPSYALLPDGFPLRCGTYVNMPPSLPYMRHEGGRNLTMAQIVNTFSGMGNLGRPAVDQTGLTGTYDWVMEFIDERPGRNPPADATGMTFVQALEKQCGLKLVSTKSLVDALIVDHIERPTGN